MVAAGAIHAADAQTFAHYHDMLQCCAARNAGAELHGEHTTTIESYNYQTERAGHAVHVLKKLNKGTIVSKKTNNTKGALMFLLLYDSYKAAEE